MSYLVIFIIAFFAGYIVARKSGFPINKNRNKSKSEYNYDTVRFIIGDLVRIKGESHEWAIVQILDDSRVLLDYNDEGNDYEALLVAGMEEVELA